MSSRQKFLQLLAQEPVDLSYVALLAVQILAEDSAEAVAATARGRSQMDALITQARAAGCGDSLARLVEYLGTECKFGGDSDNYYATDNSNLGHVLTHRSGIPITLALVYIEVGRALSFDLRGIGFPGHFLVGAYDTSGEMRGLPPQEVLLIDPFAGSVISRGECLRRLDARHTASVSQEQINEWFLPATPEQIARRLLENLKQIHLQGAQSGHALAALELQLLLTPNQFDLRAQHEALLARIFGREPDATLH